MTKIYFDKTSVIDQFGDIEDVPEGDLCDFLPNIHADKKWECDILNKWKRYFRKLNVPYYITQVGNRITLWKRLVVEY